MFGKALSFFGFFMRGRNMGMLIGGFKAVGKSTLAKKYSNVIDLESSNFEYLIDENLKKCRLSKEKV